MQAGTGGIQRAEKGLSDALKRFAGAGGEDALNTLSDALNWVHKLEEAHKNRLGEDRYFQERDRHPSGRLVGGLVYARGLDHHHMVEWAHFSDKFPSYFSAYFGEFEWRDLAQVPQPSGARPEKRGRDVF